jgi:hypothetical protein
MKSMDDPKSSESRDAIKALVSELVAADEKLKSDALYTHLNNTLNNIRI